MQIDKLVPGNGILFNTLGHVQKGLISQMTLQMGTFEFWIIIDFISGLIDNIFTLVQAMALHLTDDKLLPKPILINISGMAWLYKATVSWM